MGDTRNFTIIIGIVIAIMCGACRCAKETATTSTEARVTVDSTSSTTSSTTTSSTRDSVDRVVYVERWRDGDTVHDIRTEYVTRWRLVETTSAETRAEYAARLDSLARDLARVEVREVVKRPPWWVALLIFIGGAGLSAWVVMAAQRAYYRRCSD